MIFSEIREGAAQERGNDAEPELALSECVRDHLDKWQSEDGKPGARISSHLASEARGFYSARLVSYAREPSKIKAV